MNLEGSERKPNMLKTEKFNDGHPFEILPLQSEHLHDIQALWQRQYARRIAAGDPLPVTWLEDPALFSQSIQRHIDKQSGIVAVLGGKAVGFLGYDRFEFHAEPSAFFPILAHAAEAAHQLALYRLMYTHVAGRLVAQGCLNHFFTFFAQDHQLKTCLFELGFGLYVVDAYRDLSPISGGSLPRGISVRIAELPDVEALGGVVQESAAYYAESPLFLKRDGIDTKELAELVAAQDGAVFLALEQDEIIGFLNIRRSSAQDEQTLIDRATGCLDPLGAYIKQEYRGQGIGKALLAQALAWARQQGCAQIHVDYESANLQASRFWPRYFAPSLYSVKRRLNNDLP
jgi:GNAT superfamily N-acetyltransferase